MTCVIECGARLDLQVGYYSSFYTTPEKHALSFAVSKRVKADTIRYLLPLTENINPLVDMRGNNNQNNRLVDNLDYFYPVKEMPVILNLFLCEAIVRNNHKLIKKIFLLKSDISCDQDSMKNFLLGRN